MEGGELAIELRELQYQIPLDVKYVIAVIMIGKSSDRHGVIGV